MELTGKCKEDFEKWYRKEYHPSLKRDGTFKFHMLVFNHLSDGKKYGVYVDFFSIICKERALDIIDSVRDYYYFDYTLDEARSLAIEIENKIYNEN